MRVFGRTGNHMMLASKHRHETQRMLAVLSAALILAAPAPALALADPLQENQVATSVPAAGYEDVVEGLGDPSADNRETDCNDESLTLDESEGGDVEDAVVQAGEPADSEHSLTADSSAGLSDTPESEGITEPESEPLIQTDSIASSSPDPAVAWFVSRAYSIIGAGYQYSGYTWTGSTYDSAFTNSGVVDYARGMPSRSSSPETLYAEVGSLLVTNADQLCYGDLVFYASAGRYPGHVGIYIGGGAIIDSIPNGGVSIRSVDYIASFIGGGPIGIVPRGQPSVGTPAITGDDEHEPDKPTDSDDDTPASTKKAETTTVPTPARTPTMTPSSGASSHAALPETGDLYASPLAAALVASGICTLLAGRHLHS